jgi:hypothetical protein
VTESSLQRRAKRRAPLHRSVPESTRAAVPTLLRHHRGRTSRPIQALPPRRLHTSPRSPSLRQCRKFLLWSYTCGIYLPDQSCSNDETMHMLRSLQQLLNEKVVENELKHKLLCQGMNDVDHHLTTLWDGDTHRFALSPSSPLVAPRVLTYSITQQRDSSHPTRASARDSRETVP